MKEEDIADLIKKYTKKDAEQDERALAELQRTNAEAELLALQVMKKKTIFRLPRTMEFSYKVGILA